ncbi:retrovirus-related pol polyprotein from transposon TNT 1-94 [Tanacetum coccineum]
MEIEVDQCYVDRMYFGIEKKELLIKNDHLLEQIISQDIMCLAMHSYDDLVKYADMEQSYINEYNKCVELESELFKRKDMVEKEFYNELSKRCSRLEKQCIYLEISIQQRKSVADGNEQVNNSNVIALGMFKLDLQPLSFKLRKNKEAHIDYLKQTKEHADTLREIVEQARALNPLDSALDYALKSSTNASGSKPRSNTRNNRISRPSSSNQKNKNVEAHPRNVKSSLNRKNRVFVCNENIKHGVLNANSKLVCSTCNECLFSASHDICVVDFLNDVNARARAKSKSVKKNEWKSTGTVRFRNDQVAAIMRYGDYQIENVTTLRVYYVEGLRHNLFSMGQFCDSNLEVDFQRHSCFVRDLEGVDLLKCLRGINSYTLSLEDMMKSSLICIFSKASKTKSWLWHRRLSHLNFDTINQLAKEGLVIGLPKLKYEKYHLCYACSLGKSKKQTHKPKYENSIQEKLYMLHMDLCGPIYYEDVRITHQTSVARTLQQNDAIKRRNQTLVEVARTMLIFSKAQLFLWAEAMELLFEPLPSVKFPMPPVAASLPADTIGIPSSTTIDQDVPFASTSPTTEETQALIIRQCVEEQQKGI